MRAAYAIVKAVSSPNPPHHLPFGNSGLQLALAKLEALLQEFTGRPC